jgi:hypothetical protein
MVEGTGEGKAGEIHGDSRNFHGLTETFVAL